MKIAYITAGAGGMYCGSCLRDNVLAAELLAQGHEVHLIPTYTPTRTDEPNVSEKKVFLGGINVFLQQHFHVFRRSLRLTDRILDSQLLLKIATQWGIRTDPSRLGDLTLSMLRGTSGFQRKEIEKLVGFLEKDISPAIVNLPNSLLVALAPEIKARLRVPVCCTLQGEDLFLEGLPESYRSEAKSLIRSAAGDVDAFIAVSGYYAAFMSQYLGIDRDKIRVVPIGINLDGHRRRDQSHPGVFTIGYMARIAPEKGLHLLCEAYRRLRGKKDLPPSRVRVAGYLSPEHRAYLEDIRRNISTWGLADQFHFRGTLDRHQKIAFLQGLSVLSVPSPGGEPKGIYVLEAMANGVPVVQPRSGAFPEIIQATGGGILVEPDDPDALAQGILSLWNNPQKMEELSRQGSEQVLARFSAARMAEKALAVYKSLVSS